MEQGYCLFTIENEYYLYDFNVNVILLLSDQIFHVLKQYESSANVSKEEQIIIQKFKKVGLLQNMSYIPTSPVSDEKIAYLTFAPTYKCNFRCSYCFGGCGDNYSGESREFTRDTLVKMLDYFFFNAFPKAEHYRIDFVSGGEPLLGMETIRYTVKYVEDFIANTGKKVSMWLCTNASLLTNEIVEYLSQHNISIGVSIDGRKEFNDQYRKDKYGKGTYDSICKGIQLIADNKAVSTKFKKIWGLCTVTNDNCDFVDIIKHMQELGFASVQIRLIRGKTDYDEKNILAHYRELCDFLLHSFYSNELTYFRMILNNNDQFGKILKRILLDQLLIRRCNAGVNRITICPDETIYPCDSFVGMQEFQLGNMREGWDNELFRNKKINTIPECSNCDIKYLCGGDCFYNAYLKTGKETRPDMQFCKIQRYLVYKAISMRFKMQKENGSLYKKLVKEIKLKNDYTEAFG